MLEKRTLIHLLSHAHRQLLLHLCHRPQSDKTGSARVMFYSIRALLSERFKLNCESSVADEDKGSSVWGP